MKHGGTHHLILLYVRIPPLEHSEVQLVDLLRHRAAVVKFHHSRLEDQHESEKEPNSAVRCQAVRQRHSCAGKYLLAEFHGFVLFPERLHQRHLDPGSEACREGPPGAVPLTFPHKP